MLRRVAAFAVLALAGTALSAPEPSYAGPGGMRGGFRGGIRAPVMIPRAARAGIVRSGARLGASHNPVQWRLPAAPRLAHGLARTTVRAPFVRLERRHHHRFIGAYVYPTTTYGEESYIGIPYDPIGTIPVHAPASVIDYADPPPPAAPRLSTTITSVRDDNGEACRAERVTVPAAGGERQITVVRC